MKALISLIFSLCCYPLFAMEWMLLPELDNPYLDLYNEAKGIQIVNLHNEISELEQKYQSARERENSTANKLLGAIGIGMTGIGGMQLMSAMAEEQADQDAEAQMKAYIATFRCNYGGTNHHGGETEIELPIGDLSTLKSEYITLATDLKTRKENLGLPAGIESETIIDSATANLYDDEHIGKTNGQYTSIYRALTNKNGEDATALNEQHDATAKKKKTGAIVGGVGAAGSLVGDLIINRDQDK